jgi:phosphohistidine phosphatase
MKTLLLLRHAKSSWSDPNLSDHDRPLKERGIKAARRMGELARQYGLQPQIVLSSDAVRTRETVREFLDASHLRPNVEYLGSLYHCTTDEFVQALQQVDPTIQTVMIVGHNPGMESWLQELTGVTDLMPTAALAQIEIDATAWSQVASNTGGRLVNLWKPKELDDD